MVENTNLAKLGPGLKMFVIYVLCYGLKVYFSHVGHDGASKSGLNSEDGLKDLVYTFLVCFALIGKIVESSERKNSGCVPHSTANVIYMNCVNFEITSLGNVT